MRKKLTWHSRPQSSGRSSSWRISVFEMTCPPAIARYSRTYNQKTCEAVFTVSTQMPSRDVSKISVSMHPTAHVVEYKIHDPSGIVNISKAERRPTTHANSQSWMLSPSMAGEVTGWNFPTRSNFFFRTLICVLQNHFLKIFKVFVRWTFRIID